MRIYVATTSARSAGSGWCEDWTKSGLLQRRAARADRAGAAGRSAPHQPVPAHHAVRLRLHDSAVGVWPVRDLPGHQERTPAAMLCAVAAVFFFWLAGYLVTRYRLYRFGIEEAAAVAAILLMGVSAAVGWSGASRRFRVRHGGRHGRGGGRRGRPCFSRLATSMPPLPRSSLVSGCRSSSAIRNRAPAGGDRRSSAVICRRHAELRHSRVTAGSSRRFLRRARNDGVGRASTAGEPQDLPAGCRFRTMRRSSTGRPTRHLDASAAGAVVVDPRSAPLDARRQHRDGDRHADVEQAVPRRRADSPGIRFCSACC